MHADDESRQVRAAQNQSLFREINERIAELNEAFVELVPMGDWVCECADQSCTAPIELTIPEYEAIRSHPNRFLVLPGHEVLDVEDVVETYDRYFIVTKTGGGAAVAIQKDPRRQD